MYGLSDARVKTLKEAVQVVSSLIAAVYAYIKEFECQGSNDTYHL